MPRNLVGIFLHKTVYWIIQCSRKVSYSINSKKMRFMVVGCIGNACRLLIVNTLVMEWGLIIMRSFYKVWSDWWDYQILTENTLVEHDPVLRSTDVRTSTDQGVAIKLRPSSPSVHPLENKSRKEAEISCNVWLRDEWLNSLEQTLSIISHIDWLS